MSAARADEGAALRDTISVRGLVCDGSTDNTSALQDAISEAQAGGARTTHILVAGKGNCNFRGPLKIVGSYITLEGQGAGTALVNTSDGEDSIVFSPAEPATAASVGNRIANIRVTRRGATTGGAALRLIRQRDFQCQGNTELREHYGGLLIEGGSQIHCDGSSIASGAYWRPGVVVPGSYLLRIIPAVYGSARDIPSEIFFTSVDWKGEPQAGTNAITAVIDKGVDIEAADGVFFTNDHIGFAATNYYLSPYGNRFNILSVWSSSTYWDGDRISTTGVSMPAFSTAGNLIRDIQFNGGAIKNHLGDGVDIAQPHDVAVSFNNVAFENAGGWCLNVTGAAALTVSGSFFNCGTGIDGTGDMQVAGTAYAHLSSLLFYNTRQPLGPCLSLLDNTSVDMAGFPTFSGCAPNRHMTVGGNITIRVPTIDLRNGHAADWETLWLLQPTGSDGEAGVVVQAVLSGGGTRISDWDISLRHAPPVAHALGADRISGTPPEFRLVTGGGGVQVQASGGTFGALDLTLHFAGSQGVYWTF